MTVLCAAAGHAPGALSELEELGDEAGSSAAAAAAGLLVLAPAGPPCAWGFGLGNPAGHTQLSLAGKQQYPHACRGLQSAGLDEVRKLNMASEVTSMLLQHELTIPAMLSMESICGQAWGPACSALSCSPTAKPCTACAHCCTDCTQLHRHTGLSMLAADSMLTD